MVWSEFLHVSTVRYGESVGVNPFGGDNDRFSALVNGDGRHGLWRVRFSEADRAAGSGYCDQNWPHMRPKSLRERLVAVRASEK